MCPSCGLKFKKNIYLILKLPGVEKSGIIIITIQVLYL